MLKIILQGLLSFPDVDDPMDLDVAGQARDRPEVFAATARHWTWAFASPTRPEPSFEEKVSKLLDLESSIVGNKQGNQKLIVS